MRPRTWMSWLVIALAACSGSNPVATPAPNPTPDPPVPDPDPPPPATVLAFTASTDSMVAGAAVVLSWDVRDATTVTLDPIGTVVGNVIQLSPTVTTTYTLQASNGQAGADDAGGADSDSASVTVVVDAPTVAPPDVTLSTRTLAGGGVLLKWSPVATASGYAIERNDGYAGPLQALTTVAGDRYWFSDGTTISAPSPPEGPVGPIVTALDGNTVAPGGTLRFTATTPVTWFLPQGPGSGSITAGGVYTAPAQTGLVVLGVTGNLTTLFAIAVE